jgi:hypothetical protein
MKVLLMRDLDAIMISFAGSLGEYLDRRRMK